MAQSQYVFSATEFPQELVEHIRTTYPNVVMKRGRAANKQQMTVKRRCVAKKVVGEEVHIESLSTVENWASKELVFLKGIIAAVDGKLQVPENWVTLKTTTYLCPVYRPKLGKMCFLLLKSIRSCI